MLDPVVTSGLALLFALLFGLAAWHKLSAFSVFRAVLANYRLLPNALVPAAAVLVVVSECLLTLAWLAGYLQVAALGSGLLLGLYLLAMAINMARGRRNIDCGCGTLALSKSSLNDRSVQQLSMAMLLRNAVLIVVAQLALLGSNGRDLTLYDGFTLLVLAVAASLGYAAYNQLQSNANLMRSRGHA